MTGVKRNQLLCNKLYNWWAKKDDPVVYRNRYHESGKGKIDLGKLEKRYQRRPNRISLVKFRKI